MKLETLRKNNKNKILIGISFIFIILSIITLVTSRAKYIKTQSVTIVDNEVKFTPYDFKMMAMYKQIDGCNDTTSTECYTKMGDDERMPSTGYAINETLSYCTTSVNGPRDNEARIYTNSDGEHIINNLVKEDKCYLYFEVKTLTFEEYVLANNQGSITNYTDPEFEENGIYETTDDDGPSYYFRGNVENNYVRFGKIKVEVWSKSNNYNGVRVYTSKEECEADQEFSTKECNIYQNVGDDIYWRIIRINGDGSIRMIYAGTSGTGEAPSNNNPNTIITVGGKNTFTYSPNGAEDNKMYVGYQYKNGEAHGNANMEGGEKSNAELVVEAWFEENLLDEFQKENTKIDKNAGFCNDRTTYREEGSYPNYTYIKDDSLGIGDDITYYGAYVRIKNNNPNLKCLKEDLFTYTESEKGTKSLTYPIGLITIDEQVYGGFYYLGNRKDNINYLQNGSANLYFSMSSLYRRGFSHFYIPVGVTTVTGTQVRQEVFEVGGTSVLGLRPVLNLVSGSLIYGTGTSTDPYRVS